MYTTSLDRSLAFQHSWRLPQGKTNTPRGSLLQWLALVSTVSHRLRSIVQRKQVFCTSQKLRYVWCFFKGSRRFPCFCSCFQRIPWFLLVALNSLNCCRSFIQNTTNARLVRGPMPFLHFMLLGHETSRRGGWFSWWMSIVDECWWL